MKRIGKLFERIIDYENLHMAYLNARKGKRYRGEVVEFSNFLEENLIEIQNELIYKTYNVGRYREFFVHEPKKRLIMALPFRDRVVQWAVYQVIEPLFEKTFIYDSYACRKDKGVQRAAKRVQEWQRKLSRENKEFYVLKMDISKFFYRVDQSILLKIIGKKIKDNDVLWLIEKILKSDEMDFGIQLNDHDFDKERVEGIGIPIGNLTSQLFANIYLNELDQFVKHDLKVRYYARYMDDTIILHENKQELKECLEVIDYFLRFDLRLQLNNKTSLRLFKQKEGVEFVGKRIYPTHIKLKKSTVKRMKKRIKYISKLFELGEIDLNGVKATIASYQGLMKHASCDGLQRSIFKSLKLKGGGRM